MDIDTYKSLITDNELSIVIKNRYVLKYNNYKFEYNMMFSKKEKKIEKEDILIERYDNKNNEVEFKTKNNIEKEIILNYRNDLENIIKSLLYVKELEDKLNIIKEIINKYNDIKYKE